MQAKFTSGEVNPVAVRPACQSEVAGRFIALKFTQTRGANAQVISHLLQKGGLRWRKL